MPPKGSCRETSQGEELVVLATSATARQIYQRIWGCSLSPETWTLLWQMADIEILATYSPYITGLKI